MKTFHQLSVGLTEQKEPISAEILASLVQKFGQASASLTIRTLTICLISYEGFFRFSEVANSKGV